MPVFGPVYILRIGAEDRDAGFGQFQRERVGYLAAHGNHHAFRAEKPYNVRYPFKSQFLEKQLVTFVVIGRDRFRIAVYHRHFETLFHQFPYRLYAAPVEFHRGSDGIRSSAEDYHAWFFCNWLLAPG